MWPKPFLLKLIHNLVCTLKKKPKYVCFFFNFQKSAKSKQSPNGRKILPNLVTLFAATRVVLQPDETEIGFSKAIQEWSKNINKRQRPKVCSHLEGKKKSWRTRKCKAAMAAKRNSESYRNTDW
jgi:hypothetical protein